MFNTLRWRIGIAFVLLTLVCVGALGAYLIQAFSQSYLGSLKAQLMSQAWLVSQNSLQYFGGSEGALSDVAVRLGQGINARVTIVRSDGVVVGDSEENPSLMGSHADRPEITQALSQGAGSSIRYSQTLGYDIFYVAVPVSVSGQVVGVARVSLPLTEVNRSLTDISTTIIAGSIMAALIATVLARFISRVTLAPVKRLSRMAHSMSRGDFRHEIPVTTRDELGDLAWAFNRMAAIIGEIVATVSMERDKLAAIISRMGDGLLLVSGDRTISMVNPAAAIMLGLPPTDVSGRSFVETVRDYEMDEMVTRCFKTGAQQSATVEVLPERRWVRVIATPLETGCLVLLQDLTEMRRLEVVRRDFVSNVSHELRTPLASLKVLAETLQEGALEDPQVSKDFLGRIDSEVDKLTQMVQELGDLSQIESGAAPLGKSTFEIGEAIGGAVARLRAQADRAGLSLHTDVPQGLPSVFADRHRLEQVLINLIHNAIKFTPADGSVVVSARGRDEGVSVSVSDTGIGISADDLPRIFERFYKVDKARTGGGTGLGLAIARHIVEAHGGRIWADSVEGKGSIFHFTLPVGSEA